MTKKEFIYKLRKGFKNLPKNDIQERLAFYCEMIDDRIEDGLSEKEAIDQISSMDETVSQILKGKSIYQSKKEKNGCEKKYKTWEIILIAIGSPIWLSLLISAFAIIFSLFITLFVSIFAITISLWAIFGSTAIVGPCGIIAGIIIICAGNILHGTVLISMGLICIGLSIFFYIGCKKITQVIYLLSKKLSNFIKARFAKKEKYNDKI